MTNKPDINTPPLRILLIGDYSNMHRQLAATLRTMGHTVVHMSQGSGFQDTARDIDLGRRPGKLGGAILAARMWGPLHKHLQGYDIVALQNPHFTQLKPSRLRYFFDRLKSENERIFLTAAGTDELYVREALDPTSPLRYNEYRLPTGPAPYALEHPEWLQRWQDKDMVDFCRYVYEGVDGIVSGLYEYHIAVKRQFGADKLHYAGIPIDTQALEPYPIIGAEECVRFFLGRHRGRYAEKGTDVLEKAARVVVERHPGKAVLSIIENRPYDEYVSTMRGSHVVLDQIYSYSPATNALIAMAHGLNVVSGGEAPFYNFLENNTAITTPTGETNPRPIINAPLQLEEMVETLDKIVTERHLIAERGAASRRWVIRNNDTRTVADRFLKAWLTK